MQYIPVIAVFAATITLSLALKQTFFKERITVIERLDQYTEAADMTKEIVFEELEKPLSQRIFIPVWEKLMETGRKLVSPERKSSYEKKIILAGEPYGLDAEAMVVVKYCLMSVLVLAGIATRSLTWVIVFGLAGYLLPDFFLTVARNNRQYNILKGMPDVLDMLCVSVEAGLGFDGALQKVVEKSEGPLTEEFARSLNEIKIGKPRREALKDMAARMEVDDVTTFVGALVQADQLGVSITNVLRVQADQVREKRRQRAEETAQKAPVKILIPMLFFIFPTIFIVLLGPAAIQLMNGW